MSDRVQARVPRGAPHGLECENNPHQLEKGLDRQLQLISACRIESSPALSSANTPRIGVALETYQHRKVDEHQNRYPEVPRLWEHVGKAKG